MVNFVAFSPDITMIVWSNNYLTFIRIYIFLPMWINSPAASFPTPCHPLFTVDFANIDTLFCSSSFVTFRCKFPSDSSTAERMLFIIPSPTKLRGDIVMLPSVRPSVRHNPCEHSRINILQWILTKLGTYLVLKRSWNPIDFQGQKSRSQGQIFTA
jgi:hypothetical protein